MWISRQGFWLAVAILGLTDPGRPSFAQLVPDTSLGAQSSTLSTVGSTDTVNGGARVGANLFHSFWEFNVQSGRSLSFTDPGVTNILTRITGANPSTINGRLRVNGSANLFLINPNGIIFGANSSLDIRGSFTATTANTIKFSDGSEFGTTNLTALPLLTIAIPVGLQRGATQPVASIVNQGSLFTGQDLTFDADQVLLQGRLEARRDLTLLATDIVQVGNPATLSALVQAGRNLQVQSDRLNLLGGGQLRVRTSGAGQSGTITLGTPENPIRQIVLNGQSSGIFTDTQIGSTGGGGNISLFATDLSLTNQAQINASTSGQGNAGSITIGVTGTVNLTNASIASGVIAGATGNGGEINLAAQSLTLTNQGRIQSLTLGPGKAGDIQVQATAIVIADPFSGIISGSSTPTQPGIGTGDGGNIRLTADTLRLFNSGRVSASTFGDGRSGNIDVTARTVELSSQGQLSATTEGRGNAGSITVNARDRVTILGAPSGIFASTGKQSTGSGGKILVSTGYLTLQNRARITVDSQGKGDGGDIQLSANRVDLINQSRIFAETASTQGGNIQIQAKDLLLLRNNSLISASAGTAQAGGNGGNITITAGFVVGVLSENSDITANAFTGNGGQVNITTQGIFGLQFQPALTSRSDITANSRFGVNGTVTLNTPNIDPSQGLVPLASNFADSTNQIAPACSAQQRQNSFVVIGRGGLSPDPIEALNQTTVWTDGQEKWRREGRGEMTSTREEAGRENSTPNSAKRQQARASSHVIAQNTVQNSIVEATNWIWNVDGSISLITDNAAIAVEIANLSCHPPRAD